MKQTVNLVVRLVYFVAHKVDTFGFEMAPAPCKKNKIHAGVDGRCVYRPCAKGSKRVNGNCVPIKCTGTKVKIGGKCVRKCGVNQRRKNGVCRDFKRPGFVYNEITHRFVAKDGPTAKWIKKMGPNPKVGDKRAYSTILNLPKLQR